MENLDKAQFGVKIGCKISQPKMQWVEKWAHFEIGCGTETVASSVVESESSNQMIT
jgi:hypothetical protein